MPTPIEKHVISVVSQNILLDKTRTNQGSILPQSRRIGAIAQTLLEAPVPLDIVGVQEAQDTTGRHYGRELARLTENEAGVWAAHNEKINETSKRGRGGEAIGLFGGLVEDATEVDLGDRRKALITVIGGVAFATCHWRAGATIRSMYVRRHNALRLMEALDNFEDAVVFGDLNEFELPIISMGRAVLSRHGFESVFSSTGQDAPVTFPTPEYQDVYQSNHQYPLDDIQIRGRIEVTETGLIHPIAVTDDVPVKYVTAAKTPLDHFGVYATLKI